MDERMSDDLEDIRKLLSPFYDAVVSDQLAIQMSLLKKQLRAKQKQLEIALYALEFYRGMYRVDWAKYLKHPGNIASAALKQIKEMDDELE